MRVVAGAVAVLVLAGCSFGGEDRETRTARDSGWTSYGPPGTPPPRKLDPGFPPPAWVETKGGSFWLDYFTFCWKAGCWDYVLTPGACDGDERANDPPRIVVEPGETVRFHLGFDPRELRLAVMARTGSEPVSFELDAARDAAWTVKDGAGPAILSAHAVGSDASYVACFVRRGRP